MNLEPALREQLRLHTASAHRRLESRLGLVGAPVSLPRMQALLGRFHGFHAVWEPAVMARLGHLPRIGERMRLPRLEADLRSLGVAGDRLAALPRCHRALSLCDTPAGALGSLYVMEGSTLGGRYIARELAGADWLPVGGLGYFDPHGEHTGARWQELVHVLQAAPAAFASPALASALATFELLEDWLAPASTAHFAEPADAVENT